ncbi:MAG: beta-lactamase family protein [Ignavibacteriales bacterium]|nr:beta-lactamase family protein [Ignavibacteriales bacterium]
MFSRSLKLASPVLFALVSCSSSGLSIADAIDELFREYDRPDVPGAAVLVINGGTVLRKRVYGLADIEIRRPVTSATNFRLASVTKQFTALAVLMLAEDKKLSLDDFIIKYFPSLPASDKEIRIRHLLNHTSGIIDYEPLIPDSQTMQVLDKDVLILLQSADSVYFPAGSQFRYSNAGYALLALLVEAVACSPFADFLQERIFAPTGMNFTVARQEGVSRVSNRAYGYTSTDSGFVLSDQSVTSAVLGDGGIYSSLDDMFKWDRALNSETLLSQGSLGHAFLPTVRADSVSSYGYGWFVGDYRGMATVYHTGSSRGFRNAIIRLRDRPFTVVILTNRNEGNPIDVARKIIGLYFFNSTSL